MFDLWGIDLNPDAQIEKHGLSNTLSSVITYLQRVRRAGPRKWLHVDGQSRLRDDAELWLVQQTPDRSVRFYVLDFRSLHSVFIAVDRSVGPGPRLWRFDQHSLGGGVELTGTGSFNDYLNESFKKTKRASCLIPLRL